MSARTPSAAATPRAPRQPSLLRAVLALTGGAALAQGIGLLATPALSRLFTPEAFGLLALFSALASVAGSLATWRYDAAVALPEDDRDGATLVALACTVAALMALSLSGLLATRGASLATLLGAPGLADWLWLLPAYVLVLGAQQAHSYWAHRSGRFGTVAFGRSSQALTTVVTQLGIGAAGVLQFGGLIVGQALGLLLATVLVVAVLLLRGGAGLRAGWSLARMRALATRYADMPRYAIQTDLLNALSAAMLPLLLAHSFGLAAAGALALAERLITRPVGLLTGSIWQVAHSRLPNLPREAQVALVGRIHGVGTRVLAFPLMALALFAQLAPSLLGPRWHVLPPFVAPVALMVFFNGASNLSSYFAVFERFAAQARTNVALVVLRAAAIVIGAAMFDSVGAIWAYCLVSALLYASILVYWGATLGLLRALMGNVLGSLALAGVPLGAARLVWDIQPLAGAGAFAIAALIYGLASRRMLHAASL